MHEDEASFRQSPTLQQTWAPMGAQPQIPTRGQRNTQKILGGGDIASGKFIHRRQQGDFNAETYLDFLEQVLLPGVYRRNHRVYLIQDNASYHKKPEVYERTTSGWRFICYRRIRRNTTPWSAFGITRENMRHTIGIL